MSDLIDRQALLKQIDIDSDGEPGYYGDTWKFIDTIKNMPNVHDLPKDTDTISRAKAIDALRAMQTYKLFAGDDMLLIDQAGAQTELMMLPPAQPEQLGTNLAEVGTDCISRQAAISAICNACGKIDCDKMDKCEKLQLPPANNSEIPNSSDTISRQAAIDGKICIQRSNGVEIYDDYVVPVEYLEQLPPAQPEPSQVVKDIARIVGNEQDMTVIGQERIRGRWIYHPEWANDGECGYECSVCHMGSDIDYNFCMRCGADMRR